MAIIRIMSVDDVVTELMQDENAGWTYEGAKALAEYIDSYASMENETYELDRVALRCEFTEYESLEDFNADYGDHDSWDDVAEKTTVIEFGTGSAIVRQY